VDRKITTKELATIGLIVDGVEIIPALPTQTQAILRLKRVIPYCKIAGRVYYQQSDLVKWVADQRVEAI